jgi:hypothetical protein
VPPLAIEVQLSPQSALEFRHACAGAIAGELRNALGELGETLQNVEVDTDAPRDVAPLDFDGDLFAGYQPGSMDLADRRRSHGRVGEF